MKREIVKIWKKYKNKNNVFISSSNSTRKDIIRYMSIDKACKFLMTGELTLSCPEKWLDAYEARFQNADYTSILLEKHVPAVNAFCYSTNYCNEAAFIVYSYYAKTVYRRLSLGIMFNVEIIDAIVDAIRKKNKNSVIYIGEVSYGLQDNQIESLHKLGNEYHKCFFDSYSDDKFANLFFIKRPAFSHENESRIVVLNKGRVIGNNMTIKLDKSIIERNIGKIYVSPLAKDYQIEKIKKQLLSTGIDESLIELTPSKLYNLNNLKKKKKSKDGEEELLFIGEESGNKYKIDQKEMKKYYKLTPR